MGSQSNKIHESERSSVFYKVYYEDTDCLGMVYYANYFRFLERGRTEYLAERGYAISSLNEAGIVFVVAKVEADFKASARLGDTIEVLSSLTTPSPFKILFHQKICLDGKVLVKALTTLACIEEDGSLRRIPAELRS
ncbi:YbgC/FadM family acyl-CoA thioesterase [Dermatophilus congolensis]|uniref:YbgC/FadM family acyl-CoA thioesterase n=1 Tax=Dermatophilus congolensis TaxID=1863 RepID=UPI001AAF6455|nr:YbgC/FadM family acyl-CoA thioesterase [Dermatophilus congolensis]MBO3130430.1 YbgC/FadM family acyl-CoA thioesterase [Dermatophilus congolensis]MBO3130939.1 YbgC/FadM family acyl-CoA thioesterase [Dermatophilus congolensis]MBO3134902.1 YbgC/FadM family acyl-CoA thioesterase [Dermatophilus congolensis]MBO3137140.1 YbgC/FadM family acyl-CoA thioesterase [Dermatophilus congolensis]MBO3139384.1 YbgC/FadM family acyl-CoA thioesterase [Dermatophilus congolensis]